MVTRSIHLDPVSRVPAAFPSMTVAFGGDEPPHFVGTASVWMAGMRELVIGRVPAEVPDVVSRVCGTCSPLHQLAACAAMEAALEVQVPPAIDTLRDLLAWGDLIRSHAHHVFLLHAPDFLGLRDAWEMGRQFGPVLAWGLRLRRLGTRLLTIVGGRAVHPVNLRCGGFHRLPDRTRLESLLSDLDTARQDCLEALDWLAELSFPTLDRPCACDAVEAPRYPLGAVRRIPSFTVNGGQGTALGGPLARFNLHHARLGPLPREAAARAGLQDPCFNPFLAPVVRVIEILQAVEQCSEALRILAWPEQPCVPVSEGRAGVGCAQVETPRGLLSHAYRLDRAGRVEDVSILPPSGRVLHAVQADVAAFQGRLAEMPAYRATWVAAQMVRNHDPCPTCVAS